MRAKMRVSSVTPLTGNEGDSYRSQTIKAAPVCKDGGYPADGSDEDNSFARWSPSGDLSLTFTNPNLFGKVKEGDVFYVDFHRAVPVASPES